MTGERVGKATQRVVPLIKDAFQTPHLAQDWLLLFNTQVVFYRYHYAPPCLGCGGAKPHLAHALTSVMWMSLSPQWGPTHEFQVLSPLIILWRLLISTPTWWNNGPGLDSQKTACALSTLHHQGDLRRDFQIWGTDLWFSHEKQAKPVWKWRVSCGHCFCCYGCCWWGWNL